MSDESRFCHRCGRRVLARHKLPDMNVHGLMLLLTCGLWLPIAAIITSVSSFYVCPRCGTRI